MINHPNYSALLSNLICDLVAAAIELEAVLCEPRVLAACDFLVVAIELGEALR